MNLIVCVDENWGIGKEGQLLFHIPEDLHRFSRLTRGATVIGGRKTMESLPGGVPLPDRTNILLTRQKDYQYQGGLVCHSVEEVLRQVQTASEVFVIGGEQIYHSFLPYCDYAFVTKVYTKKEADSFCPDLDQLKDWAVKTTTEIEKYEDFFYHFVDYHRIS